MPVTQEFLAEFMKPIFDGINGLSNDNVEIKKDIGILKKDVAVLKKDVSVLKKDVALLKKDVAVLKKDSKMIKKILKGHDRRMQKQARYMGLLHKTQIETMELFRVERKETEEELRMIEDRVEKLEWAQAPSA